MGKIKFPAPHSRCPVHFGLQLDSKSEFVGPVGCKSLKIWSGCRDLNPGPLAPQASALARLRHSPNFQCSTRRQRNPKIARLCPRFADRRQLPARVNCYDTWTMEDINMTIPRKYFALAALAATAVFAQAQNRLFQG